MFYLSNNLPYWPFTGYRQKVNFVNMLSKMLWYVSCTNGGIEWIQK